MPIKVCLLHLSIGVICVGNGAGAFSMFIRIGFAMPFESRAMIVNFVIFCNGFEKKLRGGRGQIFLTRSNVQ